MSRLKEKFKNGIPNDIKALLGGLFGVLVYFAVQQMFFKAPSFEEQMQKAVAQMNQKCPVKVDGYTQLDSVVILSANSFQYNYTLFDLNKEDVNLDTVRKYLEPTVLDNVKTSPELKIYRDNKSTLIYNYIDKNGVFVHRFSVTPEMYQ